MSLARFTFTDRVRPVIEIGVGDSRLPGVSGKWGTSKWNAAGTTWSGVEPSWLDATCYTRSLDYVQGRQRTTDRFVVAQATITVDNSTGWADPVHPASPAIVAMRPGRAVRIGVMHATLGYRVLFRGFIDRVTPKYDPVDADAVELQCIDALGEVNRARLVPNRDPVGEGETVQARLTRLLDLASWPSTKRRLDNTATTLIGSDLGGQLADLLGQAADSDGGVIYGDADANVTFRARDWQTFLPGTPPQATIGNASGDVCPVSWERPFDRADIATRVIVGRSESDVVLVDDAAGQAMYGVEPFSRVDLLTSSNVILNQLATRIIKTRAAATAPRIRSVALDAHTADNAIDLMTSVDLFKPSRYRCRLTYPRGTVFDAEHFATGVRHVMTPESWSTEINLDLASVYGAAGGRWGQGQGWDRTTWANAVGVLREARRVLSGVV